MADSDEKELLSVAQINRRGLFRRLWGHEREFCSRCWSE